MFVGLNSYPILGPDKPEPSHVSPVVPRPRACCVDRHGLSAQTPYAGQQTRPIKALSDQQVADLIAGRGIGLALAAELNGYPGPSHLLELADRLDLSDAAEDASRVSSRR